MTDGSVVAQPSMLTLPDGLHADVPADVYHQREYGVVNKGLLDRVRVAPAVAKHWLNGEEEEPTPALRFGKILHHAVLEPDLYKRQYCVAPDFGDLRFKDNKAAKKEWLADHAGQTPVSSDEARAIGGMVGSLRAHPLASQILRDGQAELTATWTDKSTGLKCKARSDYWVERRGMLADLKTTEDASVEGFRKSIANYGYHRQDAFYRGGFLIAGAPVRHFVFVVVEKHAPFLVAVHALAPHIVQQGLDSIRADIETLARCLKSNDWPGIDPSIHIIDNLPFWAA